MHKIEISSIENTVCATLKIDGEPVSAMNYTLSHEAGCIPRFEVEMPVIPCIRENRVICHVSNKEEIARLMDPDEFAEFCEIWHETHPECPVSRLDKWGDD